jgi:hypothetical protein
MALEPLAKLNTSQDNFELVWPTDSAVTESSRMADHFCAGVMTSRDPPVRLLLEPLFGLRTPNAPEVLVAADGSGRIR